MSYGPTGWSDQGKGAPERDRYVLGPRFLHRCCHEKIPLDSGTGTTPLPPPSCTEVEEHGGRRHVPRSLTCKSMSGSKPERGFKPRSGDLLDLAHSLRRPLRAPVIVSEQVQWAMNALDRTQLKAVPGWAGLRYAVPGVAPMTVPTPLPPKRPPPPCRILLSRDFQAGGGFPRGCALAWLWWWN